MPNNALAPAARSTPRTVDRNAQTPFAQQPTPTESTPRVVPNGTSEFRDPTPTPIAIPSASQGSLQLAPVPPPAIEVPGVGRLTDAQAKQLVDAAQAAQRRMTTLAQTTGSSISSETLKKAGEGAALSALELMGYRRPAQAEQLRAEVGPLLDWANAPFKLAPTGS